MMLAYSVFIYKVQVTPFLFTFVGADGYQVLTLCNVCLVGLNH